MADSNDNEEQTKDTTKSKVLGIIGYSVLGLIWSIFCFFIWIGAVFAGFPKTDEEFKILDPAGYYKSQFLFVAMPIIWIVVLLAAAIIIYVIRRKRRKNTEAKKS